MFFTLLPALLLLMLTGGCASGEVPGDTSSGSEASDSGDAANGTGEDSGVSDSGGTEEEEETPVTFEDCAAISDDEACLSACVLACVDCAGVAIGDSNCDTMFYGGGSYWKYSTCETCVSLIDILDPYCPEASVEFAECV